MKIFQKMCVAAITVFFIGFSPFAWATAPLRADFFGVFSFPYDCGGFGITMVMEVDTKGTLFVDNDGNWLVYQPQNTATVEISRDDGIGVVLTGKRREMQRIDLITGAGVINGGLVKVVVPGYGPLFFDAGHTEVNADQSIAYVAGKHDFMLNETDALCAFFSEF